MLRERVVRVGRAERARARAREKARWGERGAEALQRALSCRAHRARRADKETKAAVHKGHEQARQRRAPRKACMARGQRDSETRA